MAITALKGESMHPSVVSRTSNPGAVEQAINDQKRATIDRRRARLGW